MKEKGCDGVEPDNVDGYTNDTGFNLTSNDQIQYNKFLANEAHQRGLSIGLKNNLDQIEVLEPFFDFAVNEVYSDSLDINKVSDSQVLLKGGNKYEVRAQLNCTCVFVDGYVDFTIYNVGDDQGLGVQGTCILSDNTGNSGSMIEAVAHLKYNNDVTIEVRKTNGDVITGYNTSVVIKKV